MSKATIMLKTQSCLSCLQRMERAVKRLDSIDQNSVKILFNSIKVKTAFDYPVIKSKVKGA